jgi:hypothetical protein
MSSDRRSFHRTPMNVAVSVSTDKRAELLGVTRDVSARGLLLHTTSKFSVGERVRVVFRSTLDVETRATGRVVRTSKEPERWSTFPNVSAVELDHVVPVVPAP